MAVLEISLTCQGCSRDCRATIPGDTDAGVLRCRACGRVLLNFRALKGYVYVLSNAKMPGMVKIGSTTRRVEERVEELSGATGVPTPFTVEAYFSSPAPEAHESEVHRLLDAKRIKGREFFEAGPAEVVQIVQTVVGASPVYLRDASMNLRLEERALIAESGSRWSCGLCKHDWTVRQRSVLRECPLCRSTAIVRLSG